MPSIHQDGTSVDLDPQFFEDVGIKKLGEKKVPFAL